MNKKEVSICDYCKKTVAVVTTNKLYWCANCYSSYMYRMMDYSKVNKNNLKL